VATDPGDAAQDHNVPRVVADEMDTLLAFLGYLRESVVRKCAGLDEAEARRPLVVSGTSLLGLLRHLTDVEVYWAQRRFAGLDADVEEHGVEDEGPDTVASAVADYRAAGRRTDEIVTADAPLERPLARTSKGLTLRWMLVHLVEETARHAGHADILREQLDGATGR
jgi:uncharacterized damage-inducible protein DinB